MSRFLYRDQQQIELEINEAANQLPSDQMWKDKAASFRNEKKERTDRSVTSQSLEELEELSHIQIFHSVLSYDAPYRPFRAFCRKAMRKLLTWYVQPMINDQNRFNEAVVEILKSQNVGEGRR